jgi:hypothetical protein
MSGILPTDAATASFDHLVGPGNQVWWQGKTDCSGGLEIDG